MSGLKSVGEYYMARITVEDCLQKVNNRFALIHMAAKRVRQLRKGMEPTVVTKNRDVVTALRELAAGTVFEVEPVDEASRPEEEKAYLTDEAYLTSEAKRDSEESLPNDDEAENQNTEKPDVLRKSI
jgi:DNA-directed RNA polymerase subunit omega